MIVLKAIVKREELNKEMYSDLCEKFGTMWSDNVVQRMMDDDRITAVEIRSNDINDRVSLTNIK